MPEPNLTPAQQALLDYLNKLNTSPNVTPELLNEGYSTLDQAVEERRQLEDSIADASKAISRSTPNQ
jgi:hypothetical protein